MVGSTREEENRLRINDAIVRLRDEMKPLVVEVIGEAIRRKRWSLDRMPDIWKKNIQSLEDVQNSDDPELFIVIVRNAWDNEFSPLLSPQGVSLDLVFKVINIRNYLIHYNRKLNLRNQVQVEASIGAFDHLRTAVEKVNDNRRTMRDTAASHSRPADSAANSHEDDGGEIQAAGKKQTAQHAARQSEKHPHQTPGF